MSSQNIQVCVRFRPFNAREKREVVPYSFDLEFLNENKTVKISSSNVMIPQKSYNFDYCFDENTSQEHFYNITGKPVVNDVLKGYNGTIFAYGQTGAGKSFSMMGDLSSDKNSGLIPRASEAIFNEITNSDPKIEFRISCSYLEIYNEMIQDLLNPEKKNLKVHESPTKGIYIEDLTEKIVSSVEEIYEYLDIGAQNRAVSATNMNAVSSRSHSVFLINITQTDTTTGSIKTGTLNLVDLAGSEKVGKTGASGQTLEEAKKINQSLSALGQCIHALVENKPHIPFRNSKLTRILQQSLGGNSKTTMICACSPSPFNAEETISTIKFGQRAKTIKCKVKVNQFRSAAELELLIEKLNGEIKKLRASNKKYREMLTEYRKNAGLSELNSDDDETFASENEGINSSTIVEEEDTPNNPLLQKEEEQDVSLSIAELQLKYDELQAKYNDDTEQLSEELEVTMNDNEKLEKEIKNLEKICEENELSLEELLEELDILTKEKENLEKKIEFQKEESEIEFDELLSTIDALEKEKQELENKLKENTTNISQTSNTELSKESNSEIELPITNIENPIENAKIIAEVEQLREQTKHQQELIDRYGDTLSIAYGEHEETRTQLLQLEEEFQTTKNKLLQEKDKLNTQFQNLRKEKYDSEKKLKSFQEDLTKSEAESKKNEKLLSLETKKNLRIQKDIISLQNDIRKQNSLILELKAKTQITLGTAEEELLEIYKQQLNEVHETSERMMKNHQAAINELQEEISELTKKLHISQRKDSFTNSSTNDKSLEIYLQEELSNSDKKIKELEDKLLNESELKFQAVKNLAVEKKKLEAHNIVHDNFKKSNEIQLEQLRSENENLIVEREQLKKQIETLGGASDSNINGYKGSFGRMVNELFELRKVCKKNEYERKKLIEENNHQRKVINAERVKSQNWKKRLDLQAQRIQHLESELKGILSKQNSSSTLHDKFKSKENEYLERIKILEESLKHSQLNTSQSKKHPNVYKPIHKI